MTSNCFYICLTLCIFCLAAFINAEPLRDSKLTTSDTASQLAPVSNQKEVLIPITSEEDQALDRTKRHHYGGHWGSHRRHHHYGGYGGFGNGYGNVYGNGYGGYGGGFGRFY